MAHSSARPWSAAASVPRSLVLYVTVKALTIFSVDLSESACVGNHNVWTLRASIIFSPAYVCACGQECECYGILGRTQRRRGRREMK